MQRKIYDLTEGDERESKRPRVSSTQSTKDLSDKWAKFIAENPLTLETLANSNIELIPEPQLTQPSESQLVQYQPTQSQLVQFHPTQNQPAIDPHPLSVLVTKEILFDKKNNIMMNINITYSFDMNGFLKIAFSTDKANLDKLLTRIKSKVDYFNKGAQSLLPITIKFFNEQNSGYGEMHIKNIIFRSSELKDLPSKLEGFINNCLKKTVGSDPFHSSFNTFLDNILYRNRVFPSIPFNPQNEYLIIQHKNGGINLQYSVMAITTLSVLMVFSNTLALTEKKEKQIILQFQQNIHHRIETLKIDNFLNFGKETKNDDVKNAISIIEIYNVSPQADFVRFIGDLYEFLKLLFSTEAIHFDKDTDPAFKKFYNQVKLMPKTNSVSIPSEELTQTTPSEIAPSTPEKIQFLLNPPSQVNSSVSFFSQPDLSPSSETNSNWIFKSNKK